MSPEQDTIRRLAERVTQQMQDSVAPINPPADDKEGALVSLSVSLRSIERRLAHIESQLAHDAQPHNLSTGVSEVAPLVARSPWLHNAPAASSPSEHPSAEKFGVDETVSELVDYFERGKVCDLEPGGKPCDHCAMCNSRGF
ncbi:MAG: hypothetical protein WKF30_00365 [Pyrinomonadaceae bacterium]